MKLIKIDKENIPGLNILNSLDSRIFDSPWTSPQWRSEVENESNTVIIISFDEDLLFPAGFISYGISGDNIELKKIGVLEEYRRKHLAYYAVDSMIEDARERNFHNIIIEVAITNSPAIRLYESFGFYKVSLRKKYYNNLVDALVMQKEI